MIEKAIENEGSNNEEGCHIFFHRYCFSPCAKRWISPCHQITRAHGLFELQEAISSIGMFHENFIGRRRRKAHPFQDCEERSSFLLSAIGAYKPPPKTPGRQGMRSNPSWHREMKRALME